MKKWGWCFDSHMDNQTVVVVTDSAADPVYIVRFDDENTRARRAAAVAWAKAHVANLQSGRPDFDWEAGHEVPQDWRGES